MAFDRFTKLAPVGQRPRPFEFTGLPDERLGGRCVTVLSLPATEANRAFFSESLRRSAARSRGRRANAPLTTEQVARNREEDREVMAKRCATGWKNVLDDDGAEGPFSADACLELFQKIPDFMFDEYRQWATEPANFTEEGDASPTATESAAVGEP